MKKIPLESTIVGSYKFLFQNIVSIIGVLWLPALVFVAILAAFVYAVVPHQWLMGDFAPLPDPEGYVRQHVAQIALAFPVLLFVGFLVSAMTRVGILRHALGEKTTTTWVWFSLGARVWRMVCVALLAIAVSILVRVAVGIVIAVVALVMLAIPHMPHAAIGLVIGLVVAAGVVAIIYVMLRLFFFLPAVVVAENKIGVERAWQLGKGNVWRMIAVLVVIMLPVMVIATATFYMTALATIISVAVSGHEPKTEADALEMLRSLLPLLPVMLGIWVVAGIAIAGLVLGAIGKAYKAVTAPDEVTA